MSPLDIIRTSVYSLTANRLRAALALLGIVLGVCSVITSCPSDAALPTASPNSSKVSAATS